MKKIIAVLLLVAMTFAVVACNGPKNPSGDDNKPAEPTLQEKLTAFSTAISAPEGVTEVVVNVTTEAFGEELKAEYKIAYDLTKEDQAVISAEVDVLNDLQTALDSGETKHTEIKTVRYNNGEFSGAINGTVEAVTANKFNLAFDKLQDLTIEGSTLTATVKAANAAAVLGTAIGADVSLVVTKCDDGISAITMTYRDASGNNVVTSIGYTY